MNCPEKSSHGRRAIGGYFELELRRGRHYHEGAMRLNTARNCFEYVLLARKYRKVYIPYYTCEVMLQPLHRHGVEYEFYHINERLEPVTLPALSAGEAFLYTNYFGLKQRYVKYLSEIYGSKLIVDNAQAFYAPRIEGIDTFYSPRKFFGVPDGGYLYTDCECELELQQDKSVARMKHLMQRIEDGPEQGYSTFHSDEEMLDNLPVMRMSELTERLLENIDYEMVKERRRDNFSFLQTNLSGMMTFELASDDVPLIYPYYTERRDSVYESLILQRIYVPTYWSNVKNWCDDTSVEGSLMSHMIFLPVDQRYDESDMERMVKIIRSK